MQTSLYLISTIVMRALPRPAFTLYQLLLLQLIKQTKAGQIILGARNQTPLAIDLLIDVILNASNLLTDILEIQNILITIVPTMK